jgi:hypothetical protein
MTIQYTAQADPLLAFINGLKAQTTGGSDSLNVNATLSADFFFRSAPDTHGQLRL